jgi:hypothetical protein
VQRAASPADVKRVITDVLGPYLGQNTAQAAVKGYLARLGPATTMVGPDQVEQLLRWIAPGLKVFVGDARAQHVMAELRAALQALLERP